MFGEHGGEFEGWGWRSLQLVDKFLVLELGSVGRSALGPKPRYDFIPNTFTLAEAEALTSSVFSRAWLSMTARFCRTKPNGTCYHPGVRCTALILPAFYTTQ